MFLIAINNNSICSLKPNKKPYYVRDNDIEGLWNESASIRKIGVHIRGLA